METWAWNELAAYIDDYGHGTVKFYLADSSDEPGEELEVSIDDIKFENDEIRVLLR